MTTPNIDEIAEKWAEELAKGNHMDHIVCLHAIKSAILEATEQLQDMQQFYKTELEHAIEQLR